MASAKKRVMPKVIRSRYDELKRALEDRRGELENDLHEKMRDARSDSRNEGEVLDPGESSEVEMQEAIDFALIQMKAETLTKIDTALRRLDDNTYGVCFDCGHDISEARLSALPFAVRCTGCEESHETDAQRQMTQRRETSSLFSHVP